VTLLVDDSVTLGQQNPLQNRGEVSSLSLYLARSRLLMLLVEREWTAREGPELTGDALLLL